MTYKRILLKISGEALEDKENSQIYNPAVLEKVCSTIKKVTALGVQVGMVVGGGNIWRGNLSDKIGIEQATGDYMGMLATIMNAMAVQGYFEKQGLKVRVMSALPLESCVETYVRRKAIRHLEKGNVVIFAGGVGSPFFTTDTGAALRAKEINADGIFMGKNGVDGVFDDDPRKNPDAKLLKKITYSELLAKGLKVMDNTAVGLLSGSDIDIHVFNMADTDNVLRIIQGEDIGTLISKN
ncbi:MAG: UMP kinase [Bacilli bacterium]